MGIKTTISTFTLALVLTGVAEAGKVEISTNDIHFKSIQHNQEGVLKVTGPKGYYQEFKVSQGQASLPLYKLDLKQDGLYSYELLLLSIHGQETVNDARNGRENAVRNLVSPEKVSGNFRIEDGSTLVTTEESENGYTKKQMGVDYEH